jgi:lysophospholipase L1-like esterase
LYRYLKLGAAVAAVALAIGAPTATGTPAVCAPGGPWTQTWNSALDHGQSVGPWSNQTLRMVVHTSVGGSQLRLDLSNEFSTGAVTFAHVSVAQQLDGAASVGPPTVVTFGGATSVTMAVGVETASDPVVFPTTAGERLLVSLYIPSTVSVTSANMHTYSGETEYNIVGQDATTMQNPPVNNTFSFTSYLNGLDVDAASAQTVVAAGDSITDLANVPQDSDVRWPDYLAHRTSLAVVDQGIAGNWVTSGGGTGPSLTARWQHDVLGVPGVRTAIDAGGINDLRNGVSASTLESAQASLVASAHAAGLRVLLSTLTPCAGDSQCTSAFETQRQAYNAWVRSGASGADAIADFDSAVANGAALAGIYNGGSPLHPNAAGMESMANIIDVSKL